MILFALLAVAHCRGAGFSEFISHYDILRTIAGTGHGPIDSNNYWRVSFEGGPAINATLSRPHLAMADNAGDIYIVDKNSHSVLKVTADGLIHTVAGTHTAGFNGEGPAPATALQLNLPNGLWVQGDGTYFILDTGNGRIRRVDPNGVMTTIITDTITGGRGLWVREDGAEIYFADNPNVKRWTPNKGTRIVNDGNFVDLGQLFVEPGKNTLLVTDRGANRVYRLHPNGNRDPIAGTGGIQATADHIPALQAGLYGVRAVWALNDGAYLLGTHEGSQVWHVDPQGIIRLFLNGAAGAHAGDGDYFYSPQPKVSQPRGITVAPSGNILITENDGGFVRMINFTNKPPVILAEPADQDLLLGSVLKLSVPLAGSLPLRVQWRKDGVEIPGATSVNFFIPSVQPSDSGTYTASLDNEFGALKTREARIAVTAPALQIPVFVFQPQSQTVAAGSNATVVIAATGHELSFRWLHNGRAVPGANGPALELSNVTAADAGLYRAVASNTKGRAVSRSAWLRVIRPVAILSAPQDQNVSAGSTVRLRVRARGTPRFSYQWFFNGAPIVGATGPVLVLTNLQPPQSGSYTVRVRNAASAAESSATVLVP